MRCSDGFKPRSPLYTGECHNCRSRLSATAWCDAAKDCVSPASLNRNCRRQLNLRKLARMSDADVKAALTQIKGLGSWSADVYLLMAMCRRRYLASGRSGAGCCGERIEWAETETNICRTGRDCREVASASCRRSTHVVAILFGATNP